MKNAEGKRQNSPAVFLPVSIYFCKTARNKSKRKNIRNAVRFRQSFSAASRSRALLILPELLLS
jgi:hypothetical protein